MTQNDQYENSYVYYLRLTKKKNVYSLYVFKISIYVFTTLYLCAH